MAQKRMISLKVIDTDKFSDMPVSAKYLYFEFSMRADDDGFISAPKKITRNVGCSDDDLKILIAKGFVITFECGVCVITDWLINNYIPNDRYTPTIYQEEFLCLGVIGLKREKRYVLMNKNREFMELSTACIHSVDAEQNRTV